MTIQDSQILPHSISYIWKCYIWFYFILQYMIIWSLCFIILSCPVHHCRWVLPVGAKTECVKYQIFAFKMPNNDTLPTNLKPNCCRIYICLMWRWSFKCYNSSSSFFLWKMFPSGCTFQVTVVFSNMPFSSSFCLIWGSESGFNYSSQKEKEYVSPRRQEIIKGAKFLRIKEIWE